MSRTTPYKLLAVDLDGTLLDSHKVLSERNRAAVRRAEERGVKVCLASGRMIAGIRPYAEQLELRSPVVSCNGAYVVDEAGGEIHHFCLPDDVRDRLLGYVASNNLHLNVYVRERMYFNAKGDWAELYLGRVKNVSPEVIGLADIHKLRPTKMLVVDHPEAIQEHLRELSLWFRPDEVTITISEPDYIEFLPPNINKGEGVWAVARYLGLDWSEVAAIGNWLNDLEMVRWAGLGGAVANAAEEVRQVADVVVASCDHSGVAEFIDFILDPEREPVVSLV